MRSGGAGWGVLLMGGALVMASRRAGASSSRRTRRLPTPPTDYHRSARDYAVAKLPALRARWENPIIRGAVERWAPDYLPGVPGPAVVALGASSQGADERVPAGLLGVEPRYLTQLAADAATTRELGRRVPTGDAYARDLEAQIYTGVRRYADALRSARAAIPSNVLSRDAGPVDAWHYWCAVGSYSSGAAVLARLIAALSPELSTLDARQRPQALCEFVIQVRAANRVIPGVPIAGQGGAAWTDVRPLQRYLSALALARAVGAYVPGGWFDLVGDDEGSPAGENDAPLSTLAHGV